MGNVSAVRNASAVAAALGLVACNPLARESDLEDMREEISDLREQVAELDHQVALTQSDNTHLRQQLSSVSKLGLENAGDTASLRNAVNTNADISNREKVAEMTRRGACGTELVPLYANDGSGRQVGMHNRVIPCTIKDLRPAR